MLSLATTSFRREYPRGAQRGGTKIIESPAKNGAGAAPKGPREVTAELEAERKKFYAEPPSPQLGALWNVLDDALTPEPRTRSVPYLLKWSDVRPRVMRAGELVTAKEAERRGLLFSKPRCPPGKNKRAGTPTQGGTLTLPGELAAHPPA